jgi:hypothetical protein
MTVTTTEDGTELLPEHGDYRRYRGSRTREPCRCELCKGANNRRISTGGYNATYQARLRAERVPTTEPDGTVRLVHPDPPGGHGSITAANAARCGCEDCRGVKNERDARNRAVRVTRRREQGTS